LVAIDNDKTNADTNAAAWRVKFCVVWTVLLVIKLLLAWRLPLFGDEAFYAWEADHLAWAYSDLPGMTAWLIRLGQAILGYHAFAIRLPFVIMIAFLPWLIMKITGCVSEDKRFRWQSGVLACCVPLLLPVGVMALPEAPLCIAFLCCLLAALKLTQKSDVSGYAYLLFGIFLGANTHYRFALLVVALGAVFFIVNGFSIIKRKRVILLCLFGAAAWLPLLLYNHLHANAGFQFQLIERNPWQFSWQGLLHLPTQMLVLTPLLYAGLLWCIWKFWQNRLLSGKQEALLLFSALAILACYAALAFFVDTMRSSFHWPLQAYLGLIVVLPLYLRRYVNAWAEKILYYSIALALIGVFIAASYLFVITTPTLAGHLAGSKQYPDNFLGWEAIAEAVKQELKPDEVVIADNFMLAAQLRFSYQGRVRIKVLEHPLNQKHGRARQLSDWNVDTTSIDRLPVNTPVLIVIEETSIKEWLRDAKRQKLCWQFHQLRWVTTVYGPGKGKYFSILRGKSGPLFGEFCQIQLPESH
jgi:4-amino-4-deoxy-L-arabinose transferase-like glycosyltransferase